MRRFAAALALAASACSTTPHASAPSNPLFAGADPHAEVIGDQVWIYPTGGGERGALVAWSSSDLRSWQKHGPIFALADAAWIDDDGAAVHHLWAPGLARANGRFYLYYSVGPQNPTPSRIGVAVADNPAGPFIDSGKPLVADGGNGFEAIDPMVFVDPKDGTRYLFAGGSAGATLRAWILKPDMVTIEREVPIAQPPQFTEGAFMHARGGVYYLSYSHGSYNRADYSVHYATGPSPLGPWTYRGALLETGGELKGPGHHSFFTDPKSGRFMIAYHRWERPGAEPFRGSRMVAIEPVAYRADGTIEPIRMTIGKGAPQP
jgi:beta-xylosidase